MTTHVLRTLVASTSLIASAAFATGSYHNLGAGLTATGASGDGSVVAGYGAAGGPYFYWTEATGVVIVGGTAPGNGVGGNAHMSNDGTRFSGVVLNPASGFNEMAYYSIPDATWTPLGGIGGPCSTEISSGWGMSGDGMSVVGLGWLTCADAHCTQWTEKGGTVDIGSTVPGRSSRANATDFDGNTIGGWQDSTSGFRQGAVWVDGVQTIVTPLGSASALGEVQDVSDDGVWAVGSGVSSNGHQAYRWSAATGALNIGPAPVAGWRGASVGTSADGSIVLLFYRPFPAPATFGQGYIWTADNGMENLNTYCTDRGVPIPAGDVLALPLGISADGRTFVGIGRNASGTFAFVATIDPPACLGDLDNDGTVGPADLAVLLGQWGGAGSGDLDESGTVDAADLAILLGAWGDCG